MENDFNLKVEVNGFKSVGNSVTSVDMNVNFNRIIFA